MEGGIWPTQSFGVVPPVASRSCGGFVEAGIVTLCDDGHAVSRSLNGARPQQTQHSQEDGPLAALARCGALAAAGNGCTTAVKSIQHPPPPPARAAPGRPTAPPPPPPALPPNGIGGDCMACDVASDRASRLSMRLLGVERANTLSRSSWFSIDVRAL